MSATLWLVRHGHTVVHGTGGVAGRRDVALAETGREAVRRLGPSLVAALSGRRTAPRWYASSLSRARESAALLRTTAAHERRPLAIDERLVELDFGVWEGSTWAAVHREHGAALAAWGENWVERAPPGGESFAAQATRCRAWFEECIGATAGDAIVVAHGGSIRALACHLLGWPLTEAMRLTVDPATVCRFERDARLAGGWRLAGANLSDFG